MERGLLWLPLLGVFIWLGWAGWNEYQKVEAYRVWARPFKQSKYDIYAVLGQDDTVLSWGKPTRRGPVGLQTLPVQSIQAITLEVDGKPLDLGDLPGRGRVFALVLTDRQGQTYAIPFTDEALAVQWLAHLQSQVLSRPSA